MSDFKVNKTKLFSVIDISDLNVDHENIKLLDNNDIKKHKKEQRGKQRIKEESGQRINKEGFIGGEFKLEPNPSFLERRLNLFEQYWGEYQDNIKNVKQHIEIEISLPDGTIKKGISWETTPLDIAKEISNSLAQKAMISKVHYINKVDEDPEIIVCEEEEEVHMAPLPEEKSERLEGELWDLTRPLIGDCTIRILTFDDLEGRSTFWHSSAHVLGLSMELNYGCHLTMGPPLETGFYYDAYMGNEVVSKEDFKKLDDYAKKIIKKKHPFQRLVISKEQALEMFSNNPFKKSIIENKIPPGGKTTVYRSGDLIDLCTGPHIPHTGKIKAFLVHKNSGTNWLGNVKNDPLQRIYGVSFPDKKLMKEWKLFQEQAKERDHRKIGVQQELFFFHTLSPGSCFFEPKGAHIYRKLVEFIRTQYRYRGFTEVITPNIYNLDLWNTSGHTLHYSENIFQFEIEGQRWGIKPMNCPAHCLMYANRLRSYRDLPLRFADFGVLHRNEVSGALHGLTRVRRFQQDDAHIFTNEENLKQEIIDCLDFMKFVYDIFEFPFEFELSTKPEKALGDDDLWEVAESTLEAALNEFAGEGEWRINPGDGAFYGPKIDIKVYDAMRRIHQCATIQLDFQQPIRFDLKYRNHEGEFSRPIIVHRAILGSVERMLAVLTEHWGGKWPFWISPRQAIVIPITQDHIPYAKEVQNYFWRLGYEVEVEDSTKQFKKKIRESQLAQFNYMLVVGNQERENRSVNLRTRANEVKGEKSFDELEEIFRLHCQEYN